MNTKILSDTGKVQVIIQMRTVTIAARFQFTENLKLFYEHDDELKKRFAQFYMG